MLTRKMLLAASLVAVLGLTMASSIGANCDGSVNFMQSSSTE